MRAPRRTIVALAAAVTLALLVPALALAATVGQLEALAQTKYSMQCTANSDLVSCTFDRLPWTAVITPGGPPTAQEKTLDTRYPTGNAPDAATQAWMTDMHQTACGDQPNVKQFVALVSALGSGGSAGPVTIGTCTFTGSVSPPTTNLGYYVVRSVYVPPPPPTPSPTAKPTPRPTPKPTHSAPPSAGPSETPSGSPSVAAAGPSLGATAAPSATSNVEAAQGSPAATSPGAGSGSAGAGGAGGAGGGGAATPAPTPPEFFQSVESITDVKTDGGVVAGSIVLALLMLLMIGFAAELFNDTVENNYEEISGWFRKGWLGRLRKRAGRITGEARIGLVAFLLVTALVSSFVDPHFGFDLRSLGEFLGFLVGLIVVLASFKLPPMLAHKRKTGDLGKLRPLPWALVIATLFVLVSRLGNLQPGYLYGIVLGAIFVKDVSDKEEGRETFYGSLWTLAAAALAWVALTWLRGQGYDPHSFIVTLLSTAFAATLVSGLEATAFGLMPLTFMPGHAVYQWNRLAWALLFGLSIFAFIHILIGPTSGYVSSLTPQAFVAALGVFAAFGALSIGTWGYFRFRPVTAAEALEERLER